MRWVSLVIVLAALAVAGAGCASPGSTQPEGTLRVMVIYAGGPALPGGGTPHMPVPGAIARVTPAGGGTAESARTGQAGVADFVLPDGSYSVISPTCGGTVPAAVTVTSARSTSLTWVCSIS